MVKGLKHSRERLNIMDPDSWTWNEMETSADDADSQTDSTPDLASVLLFENQLKFNSDIPSQLSSSCCYGRGKRLEDIVVPRLPEIFQVDYFLPADVSCWSSSVTWQSLRRDKHQGNKNQVFTIGRGRTIQGLPRSDTVDPQTSHSKDKCGEDPSCSTPASTAPVISRPKRSKSLLEIGFEFDLSPRPVQKTTFCVESCEDFPSLSAGNSTSSSPVRRIYGFDSESRTEKHMGGEETSSKVFEDADETSSAQSSDLLCSSQETAASKPKSKNTLVNVCKSIDPCFVENEKNVETQCVNNFSGIFESKIPAGDDSLCPGAFKPNDAENIPLKADHNSIDYTCLNSVVDVFSSSLQMDKKEDAVGKNCIAQENLCQNDNDEDDAAEKSISLSKSKAPISDRKKLTSGWKLNGALVVHVGNVPKGCGEQLRHCMSNFGKILDSEKKSKKAVVAWRYKFETKEICDYVVDCLHDAELFDGFPLECYGLDDNQENGTSL